MFRQLIEIWQDKETFLDEIVDEFEEMLKTAHRMYEQVTTALFEGGTLGTLKEDIYKSDTQLNMMEQNIRRKVVTQLSGGQEEPMAACLILMSVSKDAERLGDYAKNILQVFEIKSELGEQEPYYQRLEQVRDAISKMFFDVLQAYQNNDKNLARKIVQKSFDYQKLCDTNVKELLLATPHEDRVAFALLSRFFKRILAHLSNISTSVFMPITKIDFFDLSRRDEELTKNQKNKNQ